MPRAIHPPRTSVHAAAQPVAFGEIDGSTARSGRAEPDYPQIARSPEFRGLRSRLRRFTFSMSAVFFIWYLAYVIAAAFLPDFMSIRLVGAVNIGLAAGIGQFATTILITALYVRYASRQIDPRVRELYRNVTGEDPR